MTWDIPPKTTQNVGLGLVAVCVVVMSMCAGSTTPDQPPPATATTIEGLTE